MTSNAAWLNLSTASGTPPTETDSISASVNLTGLAAGTYTATIAVSATGANTGTIAASVNLTGLAAGTYSGTITVAATGATSKIIPVSLTVNPTTTTTTATLTWSANLKTDLAGYKIYVGTQSGIYGAPITVGPVTTYQLTNLQKSIIYFISITAYDSAGNESLHSGEVTKSISDHL